MSNRSFKQGLLLSVFFLFSLTASFAAPQVDIVWSTVNDHDSFARVITMASVKAEIMSLMSKYSYVGYNTEPMTIDDAVQNLIKYRTEIRSFGGDAQAIEQQIRWVRNNNIRDGACAMYFNFIDYNTMSISIKRGDKAYHICFQNDSNSDSEIRSWVVQSTRRSIENYIDNILN